MLSLFTKMKMNISLEQKWIGKVCIMSQALLVFNWFPCLPVDFLAHICLRLSFSICFCELVYMWYISAPS